MSANRRLSYNSRLEEEKDSYPTAQETDPPYGSKYMLTAPLPPGIDNEAIIERFTSLENEALGRMAPVLDRNLSHVTNARKAMFVCAIMEVWRSLLYISS